MLSSRFCSICSPSLLSFFLSFSPSFSLSLWYLFYLPPSLYPSVSALVYISFLSSHVLCLFFSTSPHATYPYSSFLPLSSPPPLSLSLCFFLPFSPPLPPSLSASPPLSPGRTMTERGKENQRGKRDAQKGRITKIASKATCNLASYLFLHIPNTLILITFANSEHNPLGKWSKRSCFSWMSWSKMSDCWFYLHDIIMI